MNQHPETNAKSGRKAGRLAAAIALLVVAAVIFGYNLRSNDRQAVADPSAKIRLVCKNCNYESEMLFSAYQREAPKGLGPGDGLTCPKCGAKSLQRAPTRMPDKALPADEASSGQPPPVQRPPVGRAD
jgi:hypothetical protein